MFFEEDKTGEISVPEQSINLREDSLEKESQKKAHSLNFNFMTDEFEKYLAQEYDGQISLVVPETEMIEKQITGQMNIVDIMAEWEQAKKINQEKR